MKISDLPQVNSKFARLRRLESTFDNIMSQPGSPENTAILEDFEEKMTQLTSDLILMGVDMELPE